jgi:hypothetical protein
LLYFVLEHSFELREVLMRVLDQLVYIGRRWVSLAADCTVESQHVDPDVGGLQCLFARDQFAPDRVVDWGYHLMSCFPHRHIRRYLHSKVSCSGALGLLLFVGELLALSAALMYASRLTAAS